MKDVLLKVRSDRYDFSHMTGRRFVTLDAMRGIAAISVMFFHYFLGTSYHIFEHGEYAVDFFFVLSGVVLTHAFAAKICVNMSFIEYIKIRMIRLYPLYVIGLLLGAISFLFYMSSPKISTF